MTFLSISFEDSNGRSLNSKIPNPRAFKPQLSSDKLKITYKWVSNQNLQIERIFWRESNSTYVLSHQTRISNLGKLPLNLERMRLQLGSAFQIPRMPNPFDTASIISMLVTSMLDRFYLRVVLVQHVAEELTEKLMNSFRSMRWGQTEEWNPATFHKLDGLA